VNVRLPRRIPLSLSLCPSLLLSLDMHTSGVVMFLKSKEHCAQIAEAFREGRVSKQYLCIVDVCATRRISSDSFTVNEPIERHPTVGILRQIGRSTKSQGAETHFHVVAKSMDGMRALLCVSPVTGRTHQIRLHAQHCGLPIVGDDVYGRERECYDSIEHVRQCANDPSLALYADGKPFRAGLKLHAWQISVEHPVTGQNIKFCAPPPQRFRDFADAEGLIIPT
jgi:23S rRNA-/tRNA-specific pseudouridylate synthase